MKTILLLLLSLLLCLSSFAQAEKYAVMVSSGFCPYLNYLSFTVESREIWLSLRGNGYDKENIYLLDGSNYMNNMPFYDKYTPLIDKEKYASPYWERPENDAIFCIAKYQDPQDFLNPQFEYTTAYTKTPKDWDRDGGCDVWGGSSKANLLAVCNELAIKMTPEDDLFVYFEDHGYNFENNGGYYYGFWEGDWILSENPYDYPQWPTYELDGNGDEINSYLSTIPYSKRVIYTSTCYAGAIKNHITGDNTIFICQTDENNFGYVTLPTFYKDAPEEYPEKKGIMYWGDSFNLTFSKSITSKIADFNKDGKISWAEAFQYTYANEPFSPVVHKYDFLEYPLLFDDDNIADTTYVVEATEGDVNMDGKVNMLDKVLVYNNLGLTEATWWDGDFNGDGEVTQEDLDFVLANWSPDLVGMDLYIMQSNLYDGPIIGDVNNDGFVGGGDLNLVLSNWGTSSALELLPGDINYDGFVGGEDLNLVLANWGQGVNPNVLVTEPSVCVLMGIGFASFVCKKRKGYNA